MGDTNLVPVRLVAGDSLTLRLIAAGADYPASAGWRVVFQLSPITGGSVSKIDAVDDAGTWIVRLSTTASAALVAGRYVWSLQASAVDERVTLLSGELQVAPDPASTVDRRSHARRALSAIEAVLEDRVGDPDLEYTFEDGRGVKMIPHTELMRMREYYRTEVAREEARRGGRGPMRILPRI